MSKTTEKFFLTNFICIVLNLHTHTHTQRYTNTLVQKYIQIPFNTTSKMSCTLCMNLNKFNNLNRNKKSKGTKLQGNCILYSKLHKLQYSRISAEFHKYMYKCMCVCVHLQLKLQTLLVLYTQNNIVGLTCTLPYRGKTSKL